MEGTGNNVLKYGGLWRKETESLKKFFAQKESPVKKYISLTELYIGELESNVPNEIISEYSYEQVFRQVLSLVSETFRPDHFDSYFGGLLHWLDFDFMEWLLSHQSELKRLLTWNQVCELQCNWMGWRLIKIFKPDFREMNLREMWGFGDKRQRKAMYAINNRNEILKHIR